MLRQLLEAMAGHVNLTDYEKYLMFSALIGTIFMLCCCGWLVCELFGVVVLAIVKSMKLVKRLIGAIESLVYSLFCDVNGVNGRNINEQQPLTPLNKQFHRIRENN